MAENEWKLQRVVDQFRIVCIRRKLRVNVGNIKVMVFKRKEVEMVDYRNPYRVRVPVDKSCEIVLGGERMEAVKEFKYLGIVLSKHGEMEGEVRERAVKGRSVIGSLARNMKGRNVPMEVKRGLKNSILLLTLTFGSETWMWNRALKSACCGNELLERDMWSDKMGW